MAINFLFELIVIHEILREPSAPEKYDCDFYFYLGLNNTP